MTKHNDNDSMKRASTMEQTIEEGNEFLQDFDPNLRAKKRKEREEEREEELNRASPKKKVKRSKSPPKKRSPSPKKTPKRKSTRSISPKKKTTKAPPAKKALSPPPKPVSAPVRPVTPPYITVPKSYSNFGSSGFSYGSSSGSSGFGSSGFNVVNKFEESKSNFFHKEGNSGAKSIIKPENWCKNIEGVWEHRDQLNSPAFALTVNNGKVWFGNDNGDVFGFSLTGKMERRIKLPSGVKCLVADMGHWLYAGCDDGIVYDLSRAEAPRIAYEIDSAISIDNYLEIERGTKKKRNIIFVLDRSGSMSGRRIEAATKNINMVYRNHLLPDDKITLISFNDYVRVHFSGYSKSNATERAHMEALDFTDRVSTQCSGCTALWDAIARAYTHCEEELENWVIVLTDGEDNQSFGANLNSVISSTKDFINLLVIGVGLGDWERNLRALCAHPRHLYIPVGGSDTEGITDAFKLVTQMLSSKIIAMDIRDGLIAVSDNRGNLSACDIEGNQIWSKKSSGTCGWMIKADFEGIYHGHSLGVSKYSPIDGTLLWETKLSAAVMFGFLDRREHILYISSSNAVYLISAKSGEILGHFPTSLPLICNTFDFDNHRLFAVDKKGSIYCFQSSSEDDANTQLIFASKTSFPILAIHYADNTLFATTADGKLYAFDVSPSAINTLKDYSHGLIPSLPPRKQVTTLENLEIVEPTSILPVITKEQLTDEVIVECYREFDDLVVQSISNALHDPSISSCLLEGVDYPISQSKDGLRFLKAKGLIFTQQDPERQMNFNYKLAEKEVDKYAAMAKSGQQVTWVINGEKDWGLVIDGEVKVNGTRLLIRPAANDRGFDVTKIVQFPKSARTLHSLYSVQTLTLSENGQYYRSFGEICRIDNEAVIS